MKKLAVLFFAILYGTSIYAQEADTLSQADSSDISISGTLIGIWIAISILYVVYLGFKKIFGSKEEGTKEKNNLTNEQRQLLIEKLKDKTIPFFRVKGMTYYDIKKPGGYIAELIPEDNNKKDPYAIAVVHSTLGMIGHLPKGNQFVYEKAKTQKIYGAVEIGIARNGSPYGKFWLDPSIFKIEDITQMVNVEIDDNFKP